MGWRARALVATAVAALAFGACGNSAQTSVKPSEVAETIRAEVQASLDTLNEGWSVTVDCSRMSDSEIECLGVAESEQGTMKQRYIARISQDGEVIWRSEGETIQAPNPDYYDGYDSGPGYSY